ncbi:MAG: DNA repair protein RecO [Rhodothalassiaceae bacterium]
MEWTEEGIILAAQRHGEHHALIDLFCHAHGRWRGLVRGGASRRWTGILQPGNTVLARWRARLESHLGSYHLEPGRVRAALVMDDALRLAGLSAAAATLAACLPEREPHAATHDAFGAFLELLVEQRAALTGWGTALVRLELGLLGELGYGLDLTHCAATGVTEDLVHVSPKSGRAVSREAGRPYAGKLLSLPPFLGAAGGAAAGPGDLVAGFRLTGYFLDRHVLAPHGGTLPAARGRFVDRLKHMAGGS